MAERIGERAANRALLARQGLLAPFERPLVRVVEAIGAIQAQHWPAVAAALAARVERFDLAELEAALQRGELVFGTLLRSTLHVVSDRQHPAYAAVTEASGANDWRRTTKEPLPGGERLRRELAGFTAETVRTAVELNDFIEKRLAAEPDLLPAEEAERQREFRWRALRAWSGLVRVPADGRWSKAPSDYRADPGREAARELDLDAALDEVVRRHLRAFGPAAAEDVAVWAGCKVSWVRAALDRLSPELVGLEDEGGRPLWDHLEAPRPPDDTPAPPRLLPWFDSTLLAYAGRHRARLLPERHRAAVYNRANLRYEPTFLVDGLVAGTWSIAVKRRVATITLQPLEKIPRADRAALLAEAERLARAIHPAAREHRAVFAA